jgi:hypothetical protein
MVDEAEVVVRVREAGVLDQNAMRCVDVVESTQYSGVW